MGYDFRPKEAHIAALHKTTVGLETLLEEFVKKVKGYQGIQLVVKAPFWNDKSARVGSSPLDTDWYDDYPQFIKDCEIRLTLTIKGGLLRHGRAEVYAKCRLTQLPGCCGICIMNSMELHPDVRGNGVGKEFTRLVEAYAKVLNYSYVMCTTHKVNRPAIGVLESLDYVELDDGFANMRTKNSIRMFGKNINPDGKVLTDGYLDLKEK